MRYRLHLLLSRSDVYKRQVTAEVKENSGLGAAIGSGSSIHKKDVSTAQIHITGGKINVHALYGAGIGSGSGSNAQVQIDGGMITARSWKGASVGSGYYGSSEIKINGGSLSVSYTHLDVYKRQLFPDAGVKGVGGRMILPAHQAGFDRFALTAVF